MMLVTFQEGFFDAVKNRVQRNLSNAADAVNGVVNKVSDVGRSISKTANNVSNGVQKFQNFVRPDNYQYANEAMVGAPMGAPNPPAPVGSNHNTLATNIKKQTPPGARNTTAVLKSNNAPQ